MGCSPNSAGQRNISQALDAVRARGITERSVASGKITTTDPLVIDWAPPNPVIGTHLVIEHMSFIGRLTAKATTNGTPVNGLFLIPTNTPNVETAANSVAEQIILPARGIVLPISERGCPSEPLADGSFTVNYTLQPGFKMTLPAGWSIRAIVNCAPGTNAPGPGVNSFGFLVVTYVFEA